MNNLLEFNNDILEIIIGNITKTSIDKLEVCFGIKDSYECSNWDDKGYTEDDNDIKYMLSKCKNLKELEIRYLCNFNIPILITLHNIRTLILNDPRVTNFKFLSSFNYLKKLHIIFDYVSFGTICMSNLNNLKLTELKINSAYLDNFKWLVLEKTLKNLDLFNTNFYEIEELIFAYNLKILNLSCTNIDNVYGIKYLKQLKKLNIEGCTYICDKYSVNDLITNRPDLKIIK